MIVTLTWYHLLQVDYYYNLGLRNFRVPFLWERMQASVNASLSTDYFNNYNSLIQYIIGKGATAILDPHNYARYYDNPIGSASVSVYDFVSFWRTLGARYKTRADLVVFGLMNEPHGVSSIMWFNAAQRVINALRADGVQNTILVPGNAYTGVHSWTADYPGISTDSPVISNAVHALSITDPLNNVVFEVHQYFDSDSSGTSATCATSNTVASIFANLVNWLETNNKYAYLGEFAGAANSACQAQLTAAFQLLKNNPRFIGSSWWSGGPWWGNYMYLFETSNLSGQVPQMAWQRANLIPYQRSVGYNPVATTPTSPPISPPTAPVAAPRAPVSPPTVPVSPPTAPVSPPTACAPAAPSWVAYSPSSGTCGSTCALVCVCPGN